MGMDVNGGGGGIEGGLWRWEGGGGCGLTWGHGGTRVTLRGQCGHRDLGGMLCGGYGGAREDSGVCGGGT